MNKERQLLSVRDFRGGLNTNDHPVNIGDNQIVNGVNVLLEAGEIEKRKGRADRFDQPIGTNPICGLHAYYKSDGITRLLISEGTRVLEDTPHFVHVFDSDADWASGEQINIAVSSGYIRFAAKHDGIQDDDLDCLDVHTTDRQYILRGSSRIAQTFKAEKDTYVIGISFFVDWIAGSPPDLIYEIQEVTDGKPNGVVLGSGLLSKDDVSRGKITIFCNSPAYVQTNNIYAFVLRVANDGGGTNDYYSIEVRNRYEYVDGDCLFSENGGADWIFSNYNPDDMPFAVHYAGTWVSPWINIADVEDSSNGSLGLDATVPGGTTIIRETRTNNIADDSGAEEWRSVDANGTINSTYNDWIQIRLGLITNATGLRVHKATLSYGDAPTVKVLGSGFANNAEWFWETWHDMAIGVNGADVPQKYDGDNLFPLGGSPPLAQYIAQHGDYIFLAGSPTYKSRIYWCDLAAPEVWSATNYIDVAEDDGDYITQITSFGPGYLVVFKRFSIHVLMGKTENEFRLERVVKGIGCIAPRSVGHILGGLAFLSRDGVRLFVGDPNPVWLSQPIQPTLDSYNVKRFNKAAALVYKHLYMLFVADSSSLANNKVLVLDTRHGQLGAWTIFDNWPVSVGCLFRQFNEDTPIGGGSVEAMLYELFKGYSDNGQPIKFVVETKHFDFGRRDALKKIRRIKVYSDTSAASDKLTINQQGAESINYARYLGLEVTHDTLDTSFSLYGFDIEYEVGSER